MAWCVCVCVCAKGEKKNIKSYRGMNRAHGDIQKQPRMQPRKSSLPPSKKRAREQELSRGKKQGKQRTNNAVGTVGTHRDREKH